MPFTKFVEIGRVVFIAFGRNKGKICTIVDVIDQNRALVDGPCSGVRRHSLSFKRIHLTKWRIRTFGRAAKSRTVRRCWNEDKITEKWHESNWFKRLKARRVKRRLTDFDRFRVMCAKRAISSIVRKKMRGLKQSKSETSKVKRRMYKKKMLASAKPKRHPATTKGAASGEKKDPEKGAKPKKGAAAAAPKKVAAQPKAKKDDAKQSKKPSQPKSGEKSGEKKPKAASGKRDVAKKE